MFNLLVSASLRSRLLVLAAALVLVAYGSFVLQRLPVDVFPDLNRPTVVLITEAEGLAPQEVEQLVSYPIETAMGGLPGVVRVRSVSGVGLSIVYVEFGWGVEIYRARQQVAERLATVQGRLPKGVHTEMGPISSIMGEVMLVAVTGTSVSPMELREIADFVIRPQILTIPGVAQVIPIGGEVRQYRVMPDPAAMSRLDISASDIETAIGKFGRNTGGGFVDQHAREYLIRNVGLTLQLEDLRNLVVATRQGHSILLRQVAQVDFAARVKRGDAGYMGNPAVIIGIQKQPAADTISLTRKIEEQLDSLQKTMPPGVVANKVQFRQATFIETSIQNVERVLVEAAIVVAVVLLLFLMNVRATLISLTAIPTSVLMTALVFHAFGLSINTMTLGGLAIAIGALVDDAVVGGGEHPAPAEGEPAEPEPAAAIGSHRTGEPGSPLGHLLRHGHHHPGVRAVVCAFRHRGPPVRAAGDRLHRLDPGVAADFHHPHTGAGLLSPVGAARARTGRYLRRAPSQGRKHQAAQLGLRPPGDPAHPRRRRRGGGRSRGLAAAPRLPAALQRRHDSRHPAVQPRHLARRVRTAWARSPSG